MDPCVDFLKSIDVTFNQHLAKINLKATKKIIYKVGTMLRLEETLIRLQLRGERPQVKASWSNLVKCFWPLGPMLQQRRVACLHHHLEQDPPRPISLWAPQRLLSSETLPKNLLSKPLLRGKMRGLLPALAPARVEVGGGDGLFRMAK